MKIRYLGHSCFRLAGRNAQFVTDPFDGVGIPMPRVCADAVTVSHGHFDHNHTESVEAPVVLDRAGTYEVRGVSIEAKKSFHDEVKGAKRGENLIFRFTIDGLTVCHLGDLGEDCSDELVSRIAPVDVLLVPVGGTYTIDAAQAKELIGRVKPKIAIPMHYKAKGIKLDIAPVDGFLALFPAAGIVRAENGEIELSADSLPARMKIIVMERYEYAANQ